MHADLAGEEWSDNEFGRDLGVGIAVGMPLVFVVATLISWVGDVALLKAAAIALLPAFFLGPYAGGLILMARTSLGHERHGELTGEAPTPRPSPASHR